MGNYSLKLNKLLLLIVVVSYTPVSPFLRDAWTFSPSYITLARKVLIKYSVSQNSIKMLKSMIFTVDEKKSTY